MLANLEFREGSHHFDLVHKKGYTTRLEREPTSRMVKSSSIELCFFSRVKVYSYALNAT